MIDYTKLYENEVHGAVEERRGMDTSIEAARNEFAEYLKNNFQSQLEEIQQFPETEEQVVVEEKKSGFKKFLEKLIKVL